MWNPKFGLLRLENFMNQKYKSRPVSDKIACGPESLP